LKIPHFELDELHWGPNWTIKADFEDNVAEAVQKPAWIIDGNYRKVRNIIWDKTDTLIWLNYSFPVVFSRALRRTFSRVFTKQEIFSGNRENLVTTLFSSDSILWWVIKTYRKRKLEYSRLSTNEDLSYLKIIQLNNQKETDRFLENLKNKLY
jgi:adenylate kinase family enzyme